MVNASRSEHYHSTANSTGTQPRCLFCTSKSGKRSREHVLRKEFKKHFPSAPSLTFSHVTPRGDEVVERPISQFDITVNHVCRDCNSGWLNDLKNSAWPIIRGLTTLGIKYDLSLAELEVLGFWAYVRALVRTHASPRGHAPSELFERVFAKRQILPGNYVQLGVCTKYHVEAGTHQSLRISPGLHYAGFVGFGLGPAGLHRGDLRFHA